MELFLYGNTKYCNKNFKMHQCMLLMFFEMGPKTTWLCLFLYLGCACGDNVFSRY